MVKQYNGTYNKMTHNMFILCSKMVSKYDKTQYSNNMKYNVLMQHYSIVVQHNKNMP